MKKPTSKKTSNTEQAAVKKAMSKYGISRVPMDDQYQFGNYRYTSLEHALAEAKREQLKSQ